MRALSELEHRILDLIEPEAQALGFAIVRLRVIGTRSPTLQIMAEKPDGSFNVSDCARLSRRISPLLDTHDPIDGEYALEVSSPGIDRPLTRVGDFGKWVGHEARIEVAMPVEGRKRFLGKIVAETDKGVEITLKDGGTAIIPVSEMAKAVLVLTDALIKQTQAAGQAPDELEDFEEEFDEVVESETEDDDAGDDEDDASNEDDDDTDGDEDAAPEERK